jgi:hypothetical protein
MPAFVPPQTLGAGSSGEPMSKVQAKSIESSKSSHLPLMRTGVSISYVVNLTRQIEIAGALALPDIAGETTSIHCKADEAGDGKNAGGLFTEDSS